MVLILRLVNCFFLFDVAVSLRVHRQLTYVISPSSTLLPLSLMWLLKLLLPMPGKNNSYISPVYLIYAVTLPVAMTMPYGVTTADAVSQHAE